MDEFGSVRHFVTDAGFTPGDGLTIERGRQENLFSQTMGDEWPRPAMGVFHLMFFVALHSSGSPVSVETPCPSGPRHWGQLEPLDLARIVSAKPMVRRRQKENAMATRR